MFGPNRQAPVLHVLAPLSLIFLPFVSSPQAFRWSLLSLLSSNNQPEPLLLCTPICLLTSSHLLVVYFKVRSHSSIPSLSFISLLFLHLFHPSLLYPILSLASCSLVHLLSQCVLALSHPKLTFLTLCFSLPSLLLSLSADCVSLCHLVGSQPARTMLRSAMQKMKKGESQGCVFYIIFKVQHLERVCCALVSHTV